MCYFTPLFDRTIETEAGARQSILTCIYSRTSAAMNSVCSVLLQTSKMQQTKVILSKPQCWFSNQCQRKNPSRKRGKGCFFSLYQSTRCNPQWQSLLVLPKAICWTYLLSNKFGNEMQTDSNVSNNGVITRMWSLPLEQIAGIQQIKYVVTSSFGFCHVCSGTYIYSMWLIPINQQNKVLLKNELMLHPTAL